MPPSKIADTWSPEELRQAEALARLEGWGQEKRRTALVAAEIHNAIRWYLWTKSLDPKKPTPPLPPMLSECDFLPKRVKRKAVDSTKAAAKKAKAEQRLSSIMNSLCGYRS